MVTINCYKYNFETIPLQAALNIIPVASVTATPLTAEVSLTVSVNKAQAQVTTSEADTRTASIVKVDPLVSDLSRKVILDDVSDENTLDNDRTVN